MKYMEIPRAPVAIMIVVAMVVILAGCGTTGKTKKIVLTPNDIGGMFSTREMQLQNLSLEEDGTRLLAIQVAPWGEFSGEDLQTLEASLHSSLRSAQEVSELGAPPLRIEVVVRRHLVATSNNEAAVLACVAWRAELNGQSLYEEQFYTSSSSGFIGTIGSVKNNVNKRIVSRIVRSAVLLSNSPAEATALPISIEDTHVSFEDALESLPKAMVSWRLPPPGASGDSDYVWVHQGNSAARVVPWSWAEPTDDIRWETPEK